MRRVLIPAVVAVAVVLTACGSPDRTPVIPTTTAASASSAPATTAAPAKCKLPDTASYQQAIKKRGYLVVGISSDTRLLGARNLQTNAFEGLDIEMARAVATAIFGSVTPQNLRFKAINTAQRVPFLQNGAEKGGVDMVARAMTMNCERWSQVAFAGPYFTSHLDLLVRQNDPVKSLVAAGAKHERICATNSSTTLAKVASTPGAKPVGVPLTTDCMVLWQQGQVDAIAADDAILAGLKEQDPNARIAGDPKGEPEPYGLAVSKDHKDFAAYINGVLERLRSDGGWQAAYKKSGLADALGDRTQPTGDYSRPLR
jgi:polar amino acid transport system substrate-binding protein